MKSKAQYFTWLAMVSTVAPATADIIYGSLQQTISTDYTGVTVTVGSGTLNPFFGGAGVANNNALQPFREAATGLSTIVNFAEGVTIDSGSGFLATGAGGSTDHLGDTFTAGTEGYVGFKLNAANYGWARVVFTNNTSTPVTPMVKDWAYDNTGAAIKTGWIKTDIVSPTAQTVTLNPGTGEAFTLGSQLADASGSITNSVLKTGAGTTTLTGVNTYSGTTAVNGGKLLVNGSIGNSAVTVSNANTVLASGVTGTIGNSVAVNNGAILAAGDTGVAGTATVTGATTFNNGSIFSWDINSAGTSYDKLVSTNLVDGDAAGGSVLRIVASDGLVAQNFWNTNRTWNDIFTTDGSAAIADWANIFTNISVVNSSFTSITPVGGSFSASGNTLTWTAVPEPTSALAGILLGAGLLRRRRRCVGRGEAATLPSATDFPELMGFSPGAQGSPVGGPAASHSSEL
jgi:autotransporter-associated beta strand protein